MDDNYTEVLNHAHAIGLLQGLLILVENGRPISENVTNSMKDCISQYDRIQESKKCAE